MKSQTQTKEDAQNRQIRKEAFKKLGLIFLGLLLVVNTIQLTRFGGIVERVDLYNTGLVDELGGIRSDVMEFGNDLNEIRSFLLLPVKEYSFSEKSAVAADGEEKASSRTETALYSFINQINEEKNLEKNGKLAADTAQALLADAAFLEALSGSGLTAGKIEDAADSVSFKISDTSAGPLYLFAMDKKTAKAKIQSAAGTHDISAEDTEGIKKELLEFATKNKDQTIKLKNAIATQKDAVAAFAKNAEIAKLLTDKKMTMADASETDASINYDFVNIEQEPVISVLIVRKDVSLMLKDKSYKSAEEMLPDLIKELQSADSATASEKMLAERRTELESIMAQDEFKNMLSDAGLSVSVPREEYNMILYDIKDSGGKVIFSYAIEISSGLYKVIKDEQEIDLYSAIEDDGSKKNF